MMRIFGRMFSSSQAQPTVKDEASDNGPRKEAIENETQSTTTSNGTRAGHSDRRHEQENDASPSDIEADTMNSRREKKGKAKANSKAKPGKNSIRKSQIQQELMEELGEDEGAGDHIPNVGVGASEDENLDAVTTVNGNKRRERTSKTNAKESITTIIQRKSLLRNAPAYTAPLDIDIQGKDEVSLPRSTRARSGSAVPSESGAEDPVAKLTVLEDKPAESKKSKPKNNRKEKTKLKRRSRKTGNQLPEVLEDVVEKNDDDDLEDDNLVVDLIKQARLERSKENSTVAKKPPKSRAKKVADSVVVMEKSQEDVASAGIEVLPKKSGKAKRKGKTPSKPILDEFITDNDSESVDLVNRPQTPDLGHENAPSPPNGHADIEVEMEGGALSSAPNAVMLSLRPDREDPVDDTPKQPSKKALGKRKASDTGIDSLKRQRKKRKSTCTPPLTHFGFTSQSDGLEADQPTLSKSYDVDEQSEDLGTVAARLLKENLDKESDEELELPASQINSNARRPTPAFTPINRKVIPPKNTPILPPSRLEVVLPARQPPPRQPEIAPGTQPEEHLSDSGSESRSAPEPEIPKPRSSEKRKRRLPIDEPKSSDEELPKTPKNLTASKPPKQRAMSKTPKFESTRQNPMIPASKQGAWSEEQLAELADHVQSWRSQNDMTQYDFNDMIQKPVSGQCKAAVNYICEEMSDMPRTKILNKLRRKYHNYEARGKFTEAQDEELRSLYESYPNKWKQIADIMGRFPEDCRDRWRNYLVCGDKRRNEIWGKDEEAKLKVIIAEVLESIRELKEVSADPREQEKDDETLIDWNVVSQKMGHTRSRLQCQVKWKGLKDREKDLVEDPKSTKPIGETEWRLEAARNEVRSMSANTKLRLLYAIRESGAGRERKIPWTSIQRDDFKTKGKRMALRLCFKKLRQRVPDQENMKFQEVVECLIDAFEAAAPKEPTGFDMKFGKEAKAKQTGKKRERDETGEPSSAKKKRKSIRKSTLNPGDLDAMFLDDKQEDNANDNGEGPSTRRLSITKANKPGLIQKSGPSRKKVYEKMRQQDESQSQETNVTDQRQVSEDISATMQSMKTGKTKAKPKAKQTAKKPLVKARRLGNHHLSAERISASDDELEPVPEEEILPAADTSLPQLPQDNLESEAEPNPDIEIRGMDLDQDQEDELELTETAPHDMDVDFEPQTGDDFAQKSESEVIYPDLPHDEDIDEDNYEDNHEDNDEDDEPTLIRLPPDDDYVRNDEGYGVDLELAEEDSSRSELADPDQEEPYTLPILPRQQQHTASESSDMRDSEDDNEPTTQTHDQESVDLDNVAEDETHDVDLVNAGDQDRESSSEHQVNGVHIHPKPQGAYLDIPYEAPEQRELPASQRPRSRWDGYGEALQYNRDQSQDNNRTPVPGRNGHVDPEVSSSASSIPRFVKSSAPRPEYEESNSESTSEYESEDDDEELPEDDEVLEEELVERYADSDVDDDYEEAHPRHRSRGSGRRQQSPEL